MTSFGEELKRERELRDISLKEISEATKISIRFLEALEHNNFDILPGGIFNRGFIRSYARFIGVDGEEMVNAYLHEISLRETGKGQGAQGAQTGGTEMGSVFRPETRRGPGADARVEPKPASQVIITPDSRYPIGGSSNDSGGRASMAIWILIVLAVFAGGAGLLTMRASANRPAETSTGSHVQAVKARMNKTPASAAVGSPPTTTTEPVPEEPPQQTPDNPDSPPQTAEPEPIGPAVIEHSVLIRAIETTLVTLECAGSITLSQELWTGGSKRLTCAEPVVLSADNGGAIEFSLDGGPAAFLGAMGERVEFRLLAPVPATAPATVPPVQKPPVPADETDAGN